MISIDRTSSTPVHDQLLKQLQFQIASGQFKVDDKMPSTRQLARQLQISFHTVRKVYQNLEREGLLTSRKGSGFYVVEMIVPSKGEQMERGASIVNELLQRLIGIGLDEAEIENLFEEQLALFEGAQGQHKLVFSAPYQEMAELCADQISMHLQQTVEACTHPHLGHHRDADFIFTGFQDVRTVMSQISRADVIGIVTYLNPEALSKVTRLLNNQTLGIITRFVDAIQPMMREIRTHTGFSGQMIAASIEDRMDHLVQFINQADLIVYTPHCRRKLRSILKEKTHFEIKPIIGRESMEIIRSSVPT